MNWYVEYLRDVFVLNYRYYNIVVAIFYEDKILLVLLNVLSIHSGITQRQRHQLQ